MTPSPITSKRPYHSPQLTAYGKIAALTQAVADLGNIDGAGMGAVPNRTL